MNWYYLTDENEVAGPVAEVALRAMLESGVLSPASQVCREGTEEWIELGTVHETAVARPQASPFSRSTRKRGKWGVLALVVSVTSLAIGGIWFVGGLGSNGKDPTVEPKVATSQAASAGEDAKSVTPVEKHRLWHFEFGSSRSECIATMKALKDEGVFDELDTSTVLYGWLPGAKSVEGKTPRGGEIDMEGLLSIPANRLDLFFLDDALVGISASAFMGMIPAGSAERQAEGLEEFFGTEAELRVVEDDVGNETRYFRLQNGSLVAIIRDREKGSLDVRISDSALTEERKAPDTTSSEKDSQADELPVSNNAPNADFSEVDQETALVAPDDLKFDPDETSHSDIFTNSLGMRFAKVNIPNGPTAGRTVMFSIWETRKRDYSAYAESEPTWLSDSRWKTGDGQKGFAWSDDPNSPVTFVNHADASSFCLWLTQRDQKQRLIPDHAEYRLPTDHEWSCAVGIGRAEDPGLSVEDKDGGIKDIYPWGREWPPPADFGHIRIDGRKSRFEKGFAPVGSFRPGMFGLYDMAGNVGELVWDTNSPRNIEPSRGFSFLQTALKFPKEQFFSSARMFADRENFAYQERQGRCNDLGFRCVLELDGPVSDLRSSNQNAEAKEDPIIGEWALRLKNYRPTTWRFNRDGSWIRPGSRGVDEMAGRWERKGDVVLAWRHDPNNRYKTDPSKPLAEVHIDMDKGELFWKPLQGPFSFRGKRRSEAR